MPRPLDGIVVVDFTTMVAGPAATRFLADCGADVIKVEAVGDGDQMRGGKMRTVVNRAVYGMYNAGKKSVSLDLKSDAGREIIARLIAKADVVVENFRPGVMARLGLDYATLSARHPGLVYCSISGFGQQGPLAGRAAYAPVAQAYSGFEMVLARSKDLGGTPIDNGAMLADIAGAAYAFGAIQTALLQRVRNGLGSHVDVTLVEAMMHLAGLQYQQAQSGVTPDPISYPPLKTRDGYVNIPMIAPRAMQTVLDMLGVPGWLAEARGGGQPAMAAMRKRLVAKLAEWCATRTNAECDAIMTEAGVPCAVYNEPKDVIADPHFVARGAFAEIHDDEGAINVLNPPFKISGADCAAQPFVTRAAQNNRDVVIGMLGYGAEDYARFEAAKTFG
ncbi:MAG: CaiB/BaiF CoA transferase family protein [Hyphomonadaceae bacterium]